MSSLKLSGASRHRPLVSAPQVFSSPSLQHKTNCACGGGCPRCQNALPIQTKLEVSQPGDMYELEADRVAEQIMRMTEPGNVARMTAEGLSHPRPQRWCADWQPSPSHEGDGPAHLQATEVAGHTPHPAPQTQSQIDALRGSGGQTLSRTERDFFETRFGHSFGDVRVHTDGRAAESARAIKAQAYTVGRDIVFGAGHYAPGTTQGRRLLAHELTHVLQQSRAGHNNNLLQRQAAESPEPHSVIDPRIDVRAQFALLRLFKRSPPDSKDAVDLFNDVKSEKIKGIYGDNLAVAAVLAGERGKARWELVPKGDDAIMMDDEFNDTPVIVFKDGAGHQPRLDEALLAVYRSHRGSLSTIPKTAPPAFKLPPKPAPSPSAPSTTPGCTFTVEATHLSDTACDPPLCGIVQRWKYNKVNVLPPCTFEFNANDQLIEEVSSDGKCTGQKAGKTGLCAIAPNGSLGKCTDSYGFCKPPDQIQFGGETTCTETMTQNMFIGGLTNRFFVESHQIIFTFVKSGTGCSASAVRR